MSSSAASAASSLRIIVGPTGAGKSTLALALASAHDGAIVSADSRQAFARFDIGTGKPTPADRNAVPHFGVDVVAPHERWSAARFAAAADVWIASAQRDGRTPLVVGGTGFWISALVAPLADVPDLDPVRVAALDAEFALKSDQELREWCETVDPPIARHGPAQWRRAIQVVLLTGRRLSDWHRDAPPRPPRSVRYLLVDPGTALRARIGARIDHMLATGWADEVRALSAIVPHDAVAWRACGYERLRFALADTTERNRDESVARARDDIERETWQYARRQRTWFRRQLKHGPVTHLNPMDPQAMDRATAWWQGADEA